MFKHSLAVAAAIAASSTAQAQGFASVDLLEPAETSGTIPANTRIVDVFFNVAPTDVWTAAGLRAVTDNLATIVYFDTDLNNPGIQPGLLNGGIANRFTTMISKPRGRDVANRFTNAGAAVAGGWDPDSLSTMPTLLNVAYFASPPETPDSPSFDGYIARIAIDISAVPPIPGADINEYSNWGAGPIVNVPSSARVVLRSIAPTQAGGTATATFDVPALNFLNWAMWYVPEPTSLALLALGGVAAIRRRR